MIELQKGIPLIDQHDENGYWGGKFGGNQIAESLNHPIEELTREFENLYYARATIIEILKTGQGTTTKSYTTIKITTIRSVYI